MALETNQTDTYQGFMHAGAGTSQVIVLLSAMIPGLLPTLALLGVITVVLVVPVVALGLAAALVMAPPFGLWRLATRGRRRRQREQRARRAASGSSAALLGPLNRAETVSAHLSTSAR